MSDLSELFERLADGPVLLATAFDSVDADRDNGTAALPSTLGPRRSDRGAAHRVTCEGTEAGQRGRRRSSVVLRSVGHDGALEGFGRFQLRLGNVNPS